MIVVEVINSNSGQSMVAAPIFEECLMLMKDFGKVSISRCSCNRESNDVAH